MDGASSAPVAALKMRKTLLLGMGNPILTDDAVGVRLARDVGQDLADTPGFDLIPECSIGGLDLIEVVAGYDRVIVIDAIRTRGGVPGTLHRFTGLELRDTLHLSNVHDANFATALELGRWMGRVKARAEDVHIFAVEVEDAETFGENLSASVAAAYPRLHADILAGVRDIVREAPA
jgi:hydrogenase maturation protease